MRDATRHGDSWYAELYDENGLRVHILHSSGEVTAVTLYFENDGGDEQGIFGEASPEFICDQLRWAGYTTQPIPLLLQNGGITGEDIVGNQTFRVHVHPAVALSIREYILYYLIPDTLN